MFSQFSIDFRAALFRLSRHSSEVLILDRDLADGDGLAGKHGFIDDSVAGQEDCIAWEDGQSGVGGIEYVPRNQVGAVGRCPCILLASDTHQVLSLQSPSMRTLTSQWNRDISRIRSMVRLVSMSVDRILVMLITAIANA
jgi:hypothetical protein